MYFASTVVNEMTEAAVSSGGLSVRCDHFDIQRAHGLRLELGSKKTPETNKAGIPSSLAWGQTHQY